MPTEMHNFSSERSTDLLPPMWKKSVFQLLSTLISAFLRSSFLYHLWILLRTSFNSFLVPLLMNALNKIFIHVQFIFVWELWFYLKKNPLSFLEAPRRRTWTLLEEPRRGKLKTRHVFFWLSDVSPKQQ